MPVVYLRLSISIHGLKIKDQELAEDFLKGWLKEATKAALKGSSASLFNFRDEFDTDIEVEIDEFAGKGK
jgi:hypothetical protein